MENFIVSARKYRPQNFNTVVGQAHITTTLKNAILNNHLAHAFLFCGPRGVGKTTCARILAKTINCTQVTKEGEACNTCESCVSFEKGGSLNIHELDAASNNSVDDIRALVDQVRFAPQAGKYKVYIVDEVHMLSTAAFNAFLKTLEEPPPYAIFILATTEKHKILPTILSRCQIFDFKRIQAKDTVIHLEEIIAKEHIQAEKNALQLIAQKSEGCMRDALSILDKIVSFSNGALTYANTLEHLNILDEAYYFKMINLLRNEDLANALLLYDEINQKGFEGDMVLYGLAGFIRNLLVCKDKASAHLLESIESWRAQYVEEAATISTPFLVSALNILNESEIQFKMARNKKLHVELTLIKLNYLEQAIALTMEDGQLVKKKLVDTQYPVRIKKIVPLSTLKINREAKLIIEAPPVKIPTIPTKEVASLNLEIKDNLLATLQQKYGNQYQIEEVKEARPLDMETLKTVWEAFIVQLDAQDKHSAAGSFKIANIQVIDEIHFTISVPAIVAQKFVEQERMALMEKIWERFQNRAIQFNVLVQASDQEDVPLHLRLNSKEKFEHIAEQYPLVGELKNRLNLEIYF